MLFLSELYLKSKSNLHYTYGVTSKCVTSGGTHLRDLAPGQHTFEETWKQWQAVGDTVRLDQPGNRNPNFSHRCAYQLN